jgi:hypothetical protein
MRIASGPRCSVLRFPGCSWFAPTRCPFTNTSKVPLRVSPTTKTAAPGGKSRGTLKRRRNQPSGAAKPWPL